MKTRPTKLPGVLLVEPRTFADERGVFFESWQQPRYASAVSALTILQDSVSVSRRGALRGLHYQHPHEQGKLVSVLHGAAWDVAVDVRRGSPTFGQWVGETLSADNRLQLWIPPGFAHGFQALSDGTVFHYKCTDLYHPETERSIRYDDPSLGISWPLAEPLVSAKDLAAPLLAAIPADQLPPV